MRRDTVFLIGALDGVSLGFKLGINVGPRDGPNEGALDGLLLEFELDDDDGFFVGS